MRMLNPGILARVDAGKTTHAEPFLYTATVSLTDTPGHRGSITGRKRLPGLPECVFGRHQPAGNTCSTPYGGSAPKGDPHP